METIERLGKYVTPGEMERARQDWKRDPSTWRERFSLQPERLRGTPLDDVRDALQTYFEGLPVEQPRVNRKGERY